MGYNTAIAGIWAKYLPAAKNKYKYDCASNAVW